MCAERLLQASHSADEATDREGRVLPQPHIRNVGEPSLSPGSTGLPVTWEICLCATSRLTLADSTPATFLLEEAGPDYWCLTGVFGSSTLPPNPQHFSFLSPASNFPSSAVRICGFAEGLGGWQCSAIPGSMMLNTAELITRESLPAPGGKRVPRHLRERGESVEPQNPIQIPPNAHRPSKASPRAAPLTPAM